MWVCGPCPGSLGLAQWQLGFPHLRVALDIEPGWKSPSSETWRSSADRSSVSAKSGSVMASPFFKYTLLQDRRPKREVSTIHHFYVAHPRAYFRTAGSVARSILVESEER